MPDDDNQQPSTERSVTGRGRFARLFGDFVQVYAALLLFYLALLGGLLWAHQRTMPYIQLSLWAGLNFFAMEVVLNSLVIGGIAAVAAAFARAASPVRWIVAGVLHLLYGGVLLLSWGEAMATSYFSRSGSVQMLLTNPVLLFEHARQMHPALSVELPLAIAGVTAAAMFLTLRGWRPLRWRTSVLAGALIVVWVGFFHFMSIPWSMLPFEDRTPDSYMGNFTNELYTRKIGPMTTFVAEHVLAPNENIHADPSIPVGRHPIITLEEYARGVDRDGLRKYNVLLVLVESLRSDELKIFGNELDVMPNVNRLAEESAVFLNSYCAASHSNYADVVPVSSHYPLRSAHVHVYPKNPSYPRVLIYDVLKHFGYNTAIISSQNEKWGQMINYLSTDGLDDLLHSENFHGETYVRAEDAAFAESRLSGKVDDRFTIDRAIAWIGKHRDAPFFIYANLQNSHFPFVVGPGFKRPFGDDKIDFEPRFNSLTPRMIPPMRARFRDSLFYMDEQLGRLFDHLRREGLWDNTIVVVTGDNGQAFMEHGFSAHANKLYNEALHTPLIIRVPGRPPEVSSRLAHHIDITPTVLGAAGLPKHPSFQGIDLFNEPASDDREVFLVVHSAFAEQYAIVKRGFKCIYEPLTGRSYLYDLQADPGEKANIAAANPGLVGELRRRLDTWRRLQIDYYENRRLHMTTYPPVMKDTPLPPGMEAAIRKH